MADRADLDLRRRYLAQQMELGGAEVIVDPSASAAASASILHQGPDPASEPVTVTEPQNEIEVVEAAEESDMAKKSGSKSGAEPKWMKGAPSIPGPGISVTPPPSILLGNDLHTFETLDAIAERIRTTYCCDLCPQRTNAVPGEGNPHAKLVLVGEGPGATEDATGRPFVGQAGQLLDGILQAIELPREQVYITNIVKCRPPQNRKPQPEEVEACIPYLHRQLELIAPKVILALGGTAAEALLGVKKSLGELRNKVHRYNDIPLVVTYHPAALLRNPTWKKPTWDDVRIARQLLDR